MAGIKDVDAKVAKNSKKAKKDKAGERELRLLQSPVVRLRSVPITRHPSLVTVFLAFASLRQREAAGVALFPEFVAVRKIILCGPVHTAHQP